MAKKNVALDRLQAKEKKQKRVAGVLGAVLVLVLVYEVPHTMKLMHAKAKAPVVNTSAAAPAAVNPTASASSSSSASSAALPPAVTPTAAPSQSLVTAVQVTPDAGQLTEFERFATKDPFVQSVQKLSGATTAGTPSTAKKKTTPSGSGKPQTPPAPPPTSAVISINGELLMVGVGNDFPTAGTVFSQTGASLFHLDSVTAKSAKISIAGGSYADGAPSITLHVGEPVTLQNTADGSRYTLVLEPQGTQVPTPTSTTPTLTTSTPSASVVPSSGG